MPPGSSTPDVEDFKAVFEDEVVDFFVGVVAEGDLVILEEVAVVAGDAPGAEMLTLSNL